MPAWVLRTRRTAAVLQLADDDTLLLPYWGPNGTTDDASEYLPVLPWNRNSQREFVDGLPLAYPVFGEASFKEPCLVVAREDGSRGT